MYRAIRGFTFLAFAATLWLAGCVTLPHGVTPGLGFSYGDGPVHTPTQIPPLTTPPSPVPTATPLLPQEIPQGQAPLFTPPPATPPTLSRSVSYPLSVTDRTWREVTIPRPPERVVALGGDIIEMLVSMKLQGLLVGINSDEYWGGSLEVARLIGAGRLAKVGLMRLPGDVIVPYGVKADAIIALKPDVVLAYPWAFQNSYQQGPPGKQKEQMLGQAGIPIIYLEPGLSPRQHIEDLSLLGKALGRVEAAQTQISSLKERLDRVSRSLAGLEPRRVLMETPNSTPGTMIASRGFVGPDSPFDEVIRLAGGLNVIDNMPAFYTAQQRGVRVFQDYVQSKDPEVIIFVGTPFRFDVMERFANVEAVQSNRTYVTDIPRFANIFDFVDKLAGLIHPGMVKTSFPLNVSISGQGTVLRQPDQSTYLPGTRIELKAVPKVTTDEEWVFKEWHYQGGNRNSTPRGTEWSGTSKRNPFVFVMPSTGFAPGMGIYAQFVLAWSAALPTRSP